MELIKWAILEIQTMLDDEIIEESQTTFHLVHHMDLACETEDDPTEVMFFIWVFDAKPPWGRQRIGHHVGNVLDFWSSRIRLSDQLRRGSLHSLEQT
jgi:hypothetical protein